MNAGKSSLSTDHPVVGLGQASLDLLGAIPRFPEPDAKCELTELTVQGGGPTATALVTLSRLGVKTVFIGAVGDDDIGLSIRRGLMDEGVDVTHLALRPGGRSQAAFIAVDPGLSQRTIFWHRGTGIDLSPDDVDLALIRRARLLHLDGLRIEASLAAALAARKAGVPVVFDAGTPRNGYLELAALTDYLICSEVFFQNFQKDGDHRQGLKRLQEMGPKQVVVTLGSQGSVGFDGTSLFKQKAYPVRAVDTTGAGDVYHGAYIYGILQGWNMARCMDLASAVAALKCTRPGGRTGIPGIEEALCFMETR